MERQTDGGGPGGGRPQAWCSASGCFLVPCHGGIVGATVASAATPPLLLHPPAAAVLSIGGSRGVVGAGSVADDTNITMAGAAIRQTKISAPTGHRRRCLQSRPTT